jgi:hypothetical protein
MNTTEIHTRINQKLVSLTPEQLYSVWQFIESLEVSSERIDRVSTQTILERMGGYPQHLLEGSGDLSDRDYRKKIIAEKIRKKYQDKDRRSSCLHDLSCQTVF